MPPYASLLPSSINLAMAPPSRAFFFFNDTATTEIYTLSLHDALPIFGFNAIRSRSHFSRSEALLEELSKAYSAYQRRSEEHTSELQSLAYLVCRLLLEKKKNATGSDFLTSHKQNSHVFTSTSHRHHTR